MVRLVTVLCWAIKLTTPNDDLAHKLLEEERIRRAESHRKVRRRVDRFSRTLYWLGLAAFLATLLLVLYMGSTTSLLLLSDYQQGLLPIKYFVGAAAFLVLAPLVAGIFMLRWIWTNRPSG